jgi:hypothetical protein
MAIQETVFAGDRYGPNRALMKPPWLGALPYVFFDGPWGPQGCGGSFEGIWAHP